MVSVYFPSSAVSNKEQLWDLFQDFMRKMDTTRQASLPLPARAKSGFTIPSKWSATASISFEPAAPRRSDFRPWQASSSTCTFADDFKQQSTATQDTAVSTSLPVVSVVTQSSSDASVSVVTATSMVSNMSTSSPVSNMITSSPKEASTPVSVKTTTKTDAIIEEEDIMPQLLVKEAVPLDRDREVGRDYNSETILDPDGRDKAGGKSEALCFVEEFREEGLIYTSYLGLCRALVEL